MGKSIGNAYTYVIHFIFIENALFNERSYAVEVRGTFYRVFSDCYFPTSEINNFIFSFPSITKIYENNTICKYQQNIMHNFTL